jgi:hypothetical protein
MKKYIHLRQWLLALSVACGVVGSSTLTDLQRDAEAQLVISFYGPDANQVGGAIYNDGILRIPNEQVCILNQVWLPGLVGLGKVHVQINEKKCYGYDDGRDALDAVVEVEIDSATGDTVGKMWTYDPASPGYSPPRNVIGYAKVRVTAAPTSAEPYGRFQIDFTNEDADTGELLAVFEVRAAGAEFDVRGSMPPASLTYTGYVNASSKKGVYEISPLAAVRFGFDDSYVCFKRGTSNEDCFPRALSESATNPSVTVNARSYGIYSDDGSRYTGTVGPLTINGLAFTMPQGFGRDLIGPAGDRPGGVTPLGSDGVFWDNQVATMGPGNTPMRVQWLTKSHTVQIGGARRLSTLTGSAIALDVDASRLSDPAALTGATAKTIGALPSAVLNQPVKVRDGVIQ